ncbi:DNA ligase, partial [bacterium]|nr:DNA ligase [bacterium]
MRHRIITIILMLFILAVECKAADLMLPQVYDGNQDISGGLMSEKLDGVRGYWDGKRLLSKNGTTLHPPEGFVKNFPDFAVEGEIWGGRNTFEKTVSAVMKDEPHDGWLDLKFLIFDVPSAEGGIQHRLDAALKWFAVHPSEYAVVIEQKIIANEKHLEVELSRLAKLGGEGLLIRDPHTPYIKGRNNSIL